MLSSLDAFSGYHQIPMYPPDAEKKTFITLHGLYYYNVMPFGLINVKVTYIRLVIKICRPLMGKTMEVYINDMLVKSKERPDHPQHLYETFEMLYTHDMKLNPLKCAFGVNAGKFLGFMVMLKGIEAKSYYRISYSYLQKRSAATDWSVSSSRAVHISFYRPIKSVFHHSKGRQTNRPE